MCPLAIYEHRLVELLHYGPESSGNSLLDLIGGGTDTGHQQYHVVTKRLLKCRASANLL